MTFVIGYLGLVSSIDPAGQALPTEFVGSGYNRQPARFSIPASGISKLASFCTFGFLGSGAIAGRALYASATATTPIFVMPFPIGPRSFPFSGPSDLCETESISLILSAFAGHDDGRSYSGSLFNFPGGAAASSGNHVVGSTYDATDEMNAPLSLIPRPDGVVLRNIAMAPLYCFSTETVLRGELAPVVLASIPANAS